MGLAALAVVVAGGCNTGKLVSTEQEVEVGQEAARKVESENRVVTGTDDARRVAQIGERVIAQSDRKNITYTIKLLDKNEVNAVSLPGGWLYVYTGLLRFLDQNRATIQNSSYGGVTLDPDDLLACVIGHETGHISARHHARMMGRSAIYGVALSSLTKGNVQQWAGVFASLDMLRYSRSDEYEADRLGEIYGGRASYSPWGMVAFLELLEKHSSSNRSDLGNILATHPPTPDRITRARALAEALTR